MGESTGRDKVGLAGRGVESSLSLSLSAGFREGDWTAELSSSSSMGGDWGTVHFPSPQGPGG